MITKSKTHGYIIACITIPLILASLSKLIDIRSNVVSKLPEASPASTMLIRMLGNTSGIVLIAPANVSPFSTSTFTSCTAFCSFLFSHCSPSIPSACITVTPACKILWNCLQNTAKSFALTLPPMLMFSSLFKAFGFSTVIGVNP